MLVADSLVKYVAEYHFNQHNYDMDDVSNED